MNLALEKTLSQVGSSVQNSLSSLFALNMVGSVFMTISLKSMWQLLNLCQIICLTGLLVQMPAAAEFTVNYISNVVDLNFIPLDWAKNLLATDKKPALAQIFDEKMLLLAIAILFIAAVFILVHFLNKRI